MFWPLAVTIIFLMGFFTGVAAVVLWLWLSARDRRRRNEAWYKAHPDDGKPTRTSKGWP